MFYPAAVPASERGGAAGKMRDARTESKPGRSGRSGSQSDPSRVRELEQQNAELREVVSVAAHDLKEPLRNLRACAERLVRSHGAQLEGEAQELIHGLITSAHRGERLVEDLLQYARVLGGPLRLQRVDLTEPLELAQAILCDRIQPEGAVVTKDPLPVVRADPARMIQLFQNLLANALTYRAEEPPRIHVSGSASAGGWQVHVRDWGIGVASGDRERIFEPFHRLHPEERYPGTGLGLAICRTIVERHGGRIWMESPPEGGATVVFSLPGGSEREAGRGGRRQARQTGSA
jgi:signal transduction histidine kinase